MWYSCKQCGNHYSANKTLRRHVKMKHPDRLEVLAPSLNCTSDGPHHCEICDTTYANKSNLQRHKQKAHNISDTNQRTKRKCDCCICPETSVSLGALSKHYEDEHDIQVEIEEKDFESIASFEAWKIETEKATKSRFVKARGDSTNLESGVTSSTFYCHRSGNYVPKGQNNRHVKTQASNKIGGACPASIHVHADNGQIKIKYVKTHIGHKCEVGHLVLNTKERGWLATKLAQKIPMDDILDEVRNSITNSNLDRLHLLTKKELHNIMNSYNLNSSAVRHPNDAVSVNAWVEEVEQNDNTPVLLFKQQGVVNDKYPQLKKDDFFLAIMNDSQCEMVKKYGNNCVCMDSTHGMNAYDFELTTLLVLDDIREGFPGAFLFSNRTDQQVIAVFLQLVSEQTTKISTQIFMSDIADAFYNAWVEIMGPAVRRLYCTWHVDRAWRKNLAKVKTKEKQVNVYKLVRTLLQESDESAFQAMLKEALFQLCDDDDTAEFGMYFRDTYSTCSKNWAYCYRQHSGLNTNMHIERMHKTLKYIYLQGKSVKRLDKAIHAIMKFVRDKMIDRLIIINRGKVTSKLSALRNRHKASLAMSKESVITVTEGWIVQSSSSLGEMYSVERKKEECDCKLKCEECNTCIHSYSCTCPDSAITWNMCKHIHLVCTVVESSSVNRSVHEGISDENNGILVLDTEHESNVSESEAHLKQLSTGKRKISNLESKRRSVMRKVEDIASEIGNCTTIAQLEAIDRLMTPVKPTLVAVSSHSKDIEPLDPDSFTKKFKEPANKAILKQSMYSTKKKNKIKPRIPKPSSSECQNIAASLLISHHQLSSEVSDLNDH